MGVPEAGNELSMEKIARERIGFGYDSASSQTNPIYMSDLSRLSGGNTSGSGNSYPAINTLNPAIERPDGEDPLKFSEFYSYEQNVTMTAFQYIYSSSSSNDACTAGIPIGPYYHNDTNNLYPDALDGTYTAYQNSTGTNVAASGYYSVYEDSAGLPGTNTGKYIQVGSNGAIIGGGTC